MPVTLAQVVTCVNSPRCEALVVFPLRTSIPEMHKKLEELGWQIKMLGDKPAPDHICPKCRK